MFHLLIAASLSAASPAPLAAEPAPTSAESAQPALFMVRDRDTTVYIFGTFHVLDGKSDWLSGGVRNAFESASELVLETIVPSRIRRPATAPQGIASATGYSMPVSSFVASTRLAVTAGRSRGMSAANGADMVLRHIAEAEGKQVEGLESMDSQLRMFASMPTGAIKAPRTTASAALPTTMSDLQSAWKVGDQAVFTRMLAQLRAGAPDTYRAMFTERNAHWADWIEGRLRTPGVVFVAVGAGHLAGPDSLLVRLAERGFESRRLN